MGQNRQRRKSRVEKKTVVIFGAGQIGRGFIGDICSGSGYSLIFVDVDENMVRTLNEKKEYPLWFLGDVKSERKITGFSALSFSETEKIAEAISGTELAFTAVGVNNLRSLAPLIAAGIKKKSAEKPESHLNIVICENLLGSAKILKESVEKHLEGHPLSFLNEKTGFIETVVSRMVSPLPESLRKEQPLLVTVEPYNVLPVDKKKFRMEIPAVKGFYPVENLFPYEELKLFMHNLLHACLAYTGYLKGYQYIWETLEDGDIKKVLDGVMNEAKSALMKKHRFDTAEIENYITDLIKRFGNKLLGDTVYRVGRDPLRKIGANDRIAGAIKLCLSHDIFPENICFVMACCLCYNYPYDLKAVEMQEILRGKGVLFVLKEISGISEEKVLNRITEDYNGIHDESGGFEKT